MNEYYRVASFWSPNRVDVDVRDMVKWLEREHAQGRVLHSFSQCPTSYVTADGERPAVLTTVISVPAASESEVSDQSKLIGDLEAQIDQLLFEVEKALSSGGKEREWYLRDLGGLAEHLRRSQVERHRERGDDV